jgi:hypothetical protein
MTAHTTFAPGVALTTPAADPGKAHRRTMMGISALGIALAVALLIYGGSYYTLSQAERPFSPKHHFLKPGGLIGINLGILGVLMFCGIFVYPLRKRWTWLQRLGRSKHWLDFHVVLGVAAPVSIAFHSSFKFSGLAGIAFWVMMAVAISGLIGRYLYSQIPSRVVAGEMSLKVLGEVLRHQKMIDQRDLRPLLRVPSPERVAHWPMIVAVFRMISSDVARPFRIAALRLRHMNRQEAFASCGGLLPSNNIHLEWAISLAKQQAVVRKRTAFLTRAEQVFRLWHVVHKPFSYAFAILALLHIAVAMVMGFI